MNCYLHFLSLNRDLRELCYRVTPRMLLSLPSGTENWVFCANNNLNDDDHISEVYKQKLLLPTSQSDFWGLDGIRFAGDTEGTKGFYFNNKYETTLSFLDCSFIELLYVSNLLLFIKLYHFSFIITILPLTVFLHCMSHNGIHSELKINFLKWKLLCPRCIFEVFFSSGFTSLN